ncbi:hypothetical protein HYQ45_009815 [Verticillium longisporum]|uniref:Uncharacterized protein n=1 Tax=Verticillium longisporum TaxID=100787 RepID=A0A8I2ZJN8_VERLO|nr:hypothetical protein HYQ45_009815 [Verticillium longisporum]
MSVSVQTTKRSACDSRPMGQDGSTITSSRTTMGPTRHTCLCCARNRLDHGEARSSLYGLDAADCCPLVFFSSREA